MSPVVVASGRSMTTGSKSSGDSFVGRGKLSRPMESDVSSVDWVSESAWGNSDGRSVDRSPNAGQWKALREQVDTVGRSYCDVLKQLRTMGMEKLPVRTQTAIAKVTPPVCTRERQVSIHRRHCFVNRVVWS